MAAKKKVKARVRMKCEILGKECNVNDLVLLPSEHVEELKKSHYICSQTRSVEHLEKGLGKKLIDVTAPDSPKETPEDTQEN